ncbi:beta strand repeat-containing protein [Chryseobacterium aquaeductus]|uniref:beta strand repeat-containing protein n=1 Tax=Chryseobacterium aquaeductus TaxID=2675056 RepID=UPI0013894128|nr:hypothetical protein [Chryseobacterium aquaeductus]
MNDGTASAIAQSSTTMINGVSYYVFAVPPGQVGNMQFFTFTGTQASPGGVTGESLWLRSDADTSTTVDGTNLSSWLDQSGNGNHAAQATGINQPLYRSANTGLLNFNPSIYFDGNTTSDANRDWLDITSPSNNLNTANSNYNIFASYSTQSIGQDIVCYISDGTGVKYDGYGDANTGGVLEFHLGTNTSNPDAFLQDRTAVGNTSISAYTHSIGIPFIQRGVYLNASVRVSVNGSAETSTATTRVNKTASNYRIGGHTDTTTGTFGRFFYGNLTDVIIYKSDLSAANKNRVESYLAIKNGVTLNQTTAQNYTASDGTTIFWDGTTNATYRNNIAGIARDDLSALNQKQAASQNSGIQPVVALGNIFDTNANNTNTFSGDLSALVWGSDTGSTNFATPFAFGSLNSRMTRFWKVQETGTVGTVKVALLKSQMPLNLTHHTLLVSSNDTFDGADTRTAMTLETIGGVEYYTATVLDFNSGDFFSFAALVTAPGGVITNLQRWYKGDAGVTTATGVSAWQDQAGGFTVDQGTAANQPTYNTASSLLNFNPSISFDGTNDVLTSATAGVISGSGATTYHFITTVDGTGIGKNVLNTGVVDTNDFSLRGTNGPTGHLAKVVAGNNSNLASIANAYTLNQASLTRAGYSGSANYISSEGGSETTSSAYTANVNNANIRIGSKLDGTFYWNGKIGEIITYNGKQSAADYIKVESYLAVKYGITKAGNYQNSSATVTWNSGGGYDNNIAGIAKDDASALNQKQSQSVNVATSQVVIALGTVAADNISNANTFSTDNQFFVWGDDNGSLTNILSTGNPTFSYRFTRIWKTQNTGSFAQGITVYYPVSVFGNAPSTTVSLLYGTSTTSLSNGTATAIAQTSTTTINGTSYYVFTVPSGQVSNMQFFTFTGTQTSPGGVSNNLALWLRADAGTNTTTDGASVTSWNDQSIWGRHAGNANLVNYRSGSNIKAINFNSVVDFDNADSRIYNITGGLMSTTTSLSQFFLIADVPTTGFSTQKYFGGFSSSFSSGGTFFNEAPSFRPTISAHLTSGASTSSLTFNPSLLGTKAMMGLVLNPPANTIALRQNGIQSASLPTGTSRVGNDGYILGNDNFDGWGDNPSPEAPIGEVIAYETNLSGTDLAKVESYLAIKYGMTLGTNAAAVSYLNSAGTSIWTGSTNYQNNIAGIGLDELSALNQKVSKSVNNGSVLTIATNADFTLSNDDPSRTAISNNLSALVIGDDNGSASTVVNTGLAPSFNTRLVRKWAIKNTNYTQNASLQFSGLPAGYSWNLVWDADGDFSSGAVNIGALNGSGQGTFTAAQLSTGYLSIMASAVCYKPAATIGTTLDSKYGITALGRAGSDHPDNWPMVRKGAWMVLEAKTKGLVINRLTTAQIAAIPAANLVEGMMIYDTTGNCLKVYTSTDGGSTFSWQCFSTQTCPD